MPKKKVAHVLLLLRSNKWGAASSDLAFLGIMLNVFLSWRYLFETALFFAFVYALEHRCFEETTGFMLLFLRNKRVQMVQGIKGARA